MQAVATVTRCASSAKSSRTKKHPAISLFGEVAGLLYTGFIQSGTKKPGFG